MLGTVSETRNRKFLSQHLQASSLSSDRMFRSLVVAAVIVSTTLVAAVAPTPVITPHIGPTFITFPPVAQPVSSAPVVRPTDEPTKAPTVIVKNKMMKKDDEKPAMKKRV